MEQGSDLPASQVRIETLAQMYGAHPAPEPPMPSNKHILGLRPVVFIVIACIVGLGLGLGAWLIFRPTYFKMHGVISLTDDRNFYGFNECGGTGGYSDIKEGAPVTIYSSTGEILAVGALGFGVPFEEDQLCILTYSVPEVKEGEGPYQYEISHRGRLTVTEEEAKAGTTASLGS